jgi:hypothetical protein
MKKSIFKVTAWSILIAVAVIVSVEKGFNNNGSKKLLAIKQEVAETDQSENTESNEPQGNGIDYNATASKATSEEQELGFASNSATSSNSNNSISAPVMGGDLAYENTFNKNEVSNNNEPITNEDAVAKGGPNSNSNNNSFQSQELSTLNGGITTPAPTSTNASTPTTSSRISSPTMVTTPPNPSGSTSGGSSAGDPYVPIDDYYGLIFLIVTSTVIGIFSLRKAKTI